MNIIIIIIKLKGDEIERGGRKWDEII